MSTTSNVKKTVTRIFTEKQIPDHLKNEVLRIKAEAAKVVKATNELPKSPLVKEVLTVTPRPEFLEPISPGAKMTPDSVNKLIAEYQKKNMEEYYKWEAEQPSTWLKQIEVLENQRSKIVKKGKLSAQDAQDLDNIDERIEYCENVLADLEDDYFEDSE